MAYEPVANGASQSQETLLMEGVRSFIKKFTGGADVMFVAGGPSAVDPLGDVQGYIAFRNQHQQAVAIEFGHDGSIQRIVNRSDIPVDKSR
jgi:hypothetical protein